MKANFKFFKTAILFMALSAGTAAWGQETTIAKGNLQLKTFLDKKPKVNIYNGSVYANFSKQNLAAKDIVNQLNELLKLDANHTFEQVAQTRDELGFTHTDFQQFYRGYTIEGQLIMLHEKDGILKSINGNFATLKGIDIEINITDEQAIIIAKENFNVTTLANEHPVATVFAKSPTENEYHLAKKVLIESYFPLLKYNVFVDAATGKIFNKISLFYHADLIGSATTIFSGVQQITCDSYTDGTYRLLDNARKIHTKDGATWDGYPYPNNINNIPYYTSPTTTWTQHMSLDVHWGMEKTYDYYLTTFNRDSYNGSGGAIYNIVNPVIYDSEGMQYNAAAMGNGVMMYGRGDNIYYRPFADVDVTGHEFTHMVTDANGHGGLNYQGESGALNESFSDIFATCIEFYAKPDANWLIGENIEMRHPYCMRSMSNPNLADQPDTYQGTNWQNPNSGYDEGGVHINSGVQNFWFYLLCNGGSGVNDLSNSYAVTDIGMTKAAKIAYRNLTNYITPNANFISSYQGSLQAAEDLYGNPSAEYTAVEQAWYAIGIDDATIAPPDVTGCGYYPTNLTEPSGTFDDGSGTQNYLDNQECFWIIEPQCASSVTLTFTEFDLEEDYDYVFIYDNYEDLYNGNPVPAFTGQTIPDAYTSSTGLMIVYFTTDYSDNAQGFTAHYTSETNPDADFCSGTNTLTAASGTITDGSGANGNYCNNMDCEWIIQPSTPSIITLTFTEFDVEPQQQGVIYDYVEVSDGNPNMGNSTMLGRYYGSNLPPTVSANSGVMYVKFHTDEVARYEGWTANYITTPSALEQVESSDKIKIYPNPVGDIINVQFFENQQNVMFELYDMLGKLVKKFSEQNISGNSVNSFNVADIPSGIYNFIIISDTSNTKNILIIGK
jgi:Zn-dependent metalloprotease